MKGPSCFVVGNKKFYVQDLSHKKSFKVNSVPKPYSVIWNTSMEIGAVINEHLANKRNLLLIDRNLFRIYKDCLRVSSERIFIADATENFKTLNGVIKLIDFLRKYNFTKSGQLVVVGGGIIQDVAAFVCASYKRGIPWIYFPTTLLSMCDSCIGGKTGINYKNVKNQLALFSAPTEVIIMPEFLKTLKTREIHSGLGEIVKLYVTGGQEFVDKYEKVVFGERTDLSDFCKYLILDALAIKKAIIEEDEFELCYRKSLNYGHTIGHVLEAMSNYAIPHGQAVVAGMIVVNELSFRRGFLNGAQKSRLANLLFTLLDLNSFRAIKLNMIESLLRSDKKNTGDIVNFVIIESIGRTRFLPLKINRSLLKEMALIIRTQLVNKR